MNKTLERDINEFVSHCHFLEDLKGSSFLITGGTGLIGSTIARCLLAMNNGIQITIPVRNFGKAISMYGENTVNLNIIPCELIEYVNHVKEHFDYIIHCASPTVGKYMNDHPVETYELAIESTSALLRYAQRHEIKGMVYLSSLEYYGENHDDCLITEDKQGYVVPMSPRSSYPMGKRAAEYLVTAYAHEYSVPAKVARLTQTFGAGVSVDDNRVFAQFARSILSGTDIVLHTKGESAKPYCYTTDCVSAILHILLRGRSGEAYNVANPDTYITIRELAEFLRTNFNQSVKIVIDEYPEMGYAPITKLNLSVEKLKRLGWKPMYNMNEMFARLIESYKNLYFVCE